MPALRVERRSPVVGCLGVFEKFSQSARQVVVEAHEEARGLNHNYIGTEHQLLGLLSDRDQAAGRVLRSFGITDERVRDQVVSIVGRGEEPSKGQIPFTHRAKKVLGSPCVRRRASGTTTSRLSIYYSDSCVKTRA